MYLADQFLPRLLEMGLDQDTIDQIVRRNPAEWLTIRPV